ncbi:MAG TPA: hypothetical protein VKT71_10870 [Candidatus Acidoferrales bacterium]|nr:hypothetical protein [Candidatus Acidoferrales bacterium]
MTPDSQNGGGSGGQPVPGPFDEIAAALASMPPPREVRLSRRGKTTVTVLMIALLAALAGYLVTLAVARRALGDQPPQASQFPLDAVAIGTIAVISIVLLTVVARQKQLMAEGEVAVARVTRQWQTHRGPAIRYEFTTLRGEQLLGGASDGSRTLTVGMSVPVFYDAQKPKRQLALCASFFEVNVPGRE